MTINLKALHKFVLILKYLSELFNEGLETDKR